MRWSSVVWSILSLLLVLSLFTPFQILTLSFVAVPLTVLARMLSGKQLTVHILLIGVISFFVMGTFGSAAILFLLYFVLPAVVMGRLYRRNSSALAVVLSGTVALLLESVVILFVVNVMLGFHVNDYIGELVHTSLELIQNAKLMPAGWEPEMTDILITTMTSLMPFALMFSSVCIAAVTHAVSQRILNRQGLSVPRFKPLREWMLPRSLIWYYLIAVIFDMFIPVGDTSFMSIVVLNVLPVLKAAFIVQTMCFFFYVAHAKRWSKVIPFLLMIPLIIFPPLRIIGLMDIAFPIRQSLIKPKL